MKLLHLVSDLCWRATVAKEWRRRSFPGSDFVLWRGLYFKGSGDNREAKSRSSEAVLEQNPLHARAHIYTYGHLKKAFTHGHLLIHIYSFVLLWLSKSYPNRMLIIDTASKIVTVFEVEFIKSCKTDFHKSTFTSIILVTISCLSSLLFIFIYFLAPSLVDFLLIPLYVSFSSSPPSFTSYAPVSFYIRLVIIFKGTRKHAFYFPPRMCQLMQPFISGVMICEDGRGSC